jgi:hypothetical protein
MPKSGVVHSGNLMGILGKRVQIIHPPARDKASRTLIMKSGVVVKLLRSKVEVILDDGRKVCVARRFLRLNTNSRMHAVDIHINASGLKIMDMCESQSMKRSVLMSS